MTHRVVAHTGRMTRRRRPLSALLLAGVGVLGVALPALGADVMSATARTSAEAWFRSTPSCSMPTGCLAQERALAPQYAPDTLHVGVHFGSEEARTHLRLDLAALPAGTSATDGVLRLPVAAGPDDGTRAPETAKIRACFLVDHVDEVNGSFDEPPAPDCEAASVPAVFAPATEAGPAIFTVDLGGLLTLWRSSPQPGVLALLPAEGAAPADRWHVAFSQRDRVGDDVEPITAALALVTQSSEVPPAPPPAVAAPALGGVAEALGGVAEAPGGVAEAPGFVPPAAMTFAAPALPVPAGQDPSLAAPLVTAAQPVAPAAAVTPVAQPLSAPFRYPGVFLLPLLFVGAASWIARALTRDLAVAPLPVSAPTRGTNRS
jgi:hypothetical protein